MLLTAASVVFVNQVDDYRAGAETAKAELAAARAQQAQAEIAAAQGRDLAETARNAALTEAQVARTALSAAQAIVAERDKDIAGKTTQLTLQSADLNRLTEALKASEDQKSRQSEQLADLRTKFDERVSQNADLNAQVSELTNRLDVTERERRLLAEQVAELQTQNSKLGGILKDNNINPNDVVAGGIRGGAPPINGVVRDVRNISGIEYATISVGGADNVVKGMEFKVINRNSGEFLGTLTVDTVEPNESTGRLSGPKVAEIRAGTEVRTQL
jgi:multidrug efflux pump subunit AcrA (membrane-fusion protein)